VSVRRHAGACEISRTLVAGAGATTPAPGTRLLTVVLFFEFMLVAAVVVITWFALYALYRLVTDES
jgi:hypothetical protein